MKDYIAGKTHEQLLIRQKELEAYCADQLLHTGPGESPWGIETQAELDQLRAYFRQPLDAVGLLHGTDKASSFHGYLETYEQYFSPLRDRRLTLLEIGVAGGNSLRAWLDYFPQAEVLGLDHNPACNGDFSERGSVRIADATDPSTWVHLRGCAYQFDIVIDDGGHFSSQIITAFVLGWPLLKSGGLWIIEDTHATYANEEGQKARLWTWLTNQIHALNEYGQGQCGRPTEGDVAFIHLYKSLIVIGKR